jgi:hypothetical protein
MILLFKLFLIKKYIEIKKNIKIINIEEIFF